MLKPRCAAVLASLRANVEGDLVGGFQMVYLDNAKPSDMTLAAFCGHLSHLEAVGLYRPVDGFAWGEVREPR